MSEEVSIGNIVSTVLCLLIVVTAFASTPITTATGHVDPPPDSQTIDWSNDITVWELSVFPLRIDTSNAPTTVQNPSWKLIDVENTQKFLNKYSGKIYNPNDKISISFVDGRAQYAGFDENDHVQLIAVKLDKDAGSDDGTGFFDAFSLLDDNKDSGATFYKVADKHLDSTGRADFSFKPSNHGGAGRYIFFLGHNEENKGGFQVSEGELLINGNVTIIGVEQATVQKRASNISAPSSVSRGDNFTLSSDVSEQINGDHVTHAVILFDENKYQQSDFEIHLNKEISDDFNFTESSTIKHSIAEVNGVGRIQGDLDDLGINLDDGEVYPPPNVAATIDFISEEVSDPEPNTTEIGSTILDGSITVINGSASETIDVGTLSNWSTGAYRWVHVAIGADNTEIVSNTGTVNIINQTKTGPTVVGDSPAKDLDGDGLFEDVNGDGQFNIIDVGALLFNRQSTVVQNNIPMFDFNNDERVNIIDVGKMLQLYRVK